jgi:hypothetical protein
MAWSCSSGDGNEGILNVRPRVGTVLQPDPADLPGAPYLLPTDGGTPGQGELRVNIHVQAVTDLWALAFTLEYNPAILQYVGDSAVNGGFLGIDERVDVEVASGGSGRLVVGVSRLRVLPDDVGVDGTGSVMTLDFTLLAAGQTTLGFVLPPDANLAAVDSQGQPIANFGVDKFVPVTVQVQ